MRKFVRRLISLGRKLLCGDFCLKFIAGFLSLLTLVVFLDSVLAAVSSLSWKYSGIVSHPSAGSLDLAKMVMMF